MGAPKSLSEIENTEILGLLSVSNFSSTYLYFSPCYLMQIFGNSILMGCITAFKHVREFESQGSVICTFENTITSIYDVKMDRMAVNFLAVFAYGKLFLCFRPFYSSLQPEPFQRDKRAGE